MHAACLETNVLQAAGAPWSVELDESREECLVNVNLRREKRNRSKKTYSISWSDESGLTHSAEVQGIDFSPSGVGVLSSVEVRPGTTVYIQAQDGHPKGYSAVRHCTLRDDTYIIGLELDESTKKTVAALPRH